MPRQCSIQICARRERWYNVLCLGGLVTLLLFPRSKAAAGAAKAASLPVSEPQHVRLPSGALMPIIGMGTAAIKAPEAVK